MYIILKIGTQFCDCQHKAVSTNLRQIIYAVPWQQFSDFCVLVGGGGRFNMYRDLQWHALVAKTVGKESCSQTEYTYEIQPFPWYMHVFQMPWSASFTIQAFFLYYATSI